MDYKKSVETLGDKDYIKLKANTGLVKLEGANCIRLYGTNIITYFPDGRITLNSGNYISKLTRDRINEYLYVAKVYQLKGMWYVGYGDETYIYEDRMTLFPDGSCDAKFLSVHEFEEAGEDVNTIVDVRRVTAGSSIETLKMLWEKCKYSRGLIAYYATLEFIPLIISTGSKKDSWYQVAKNRLTEG